MARFELATSWSQTRRDNRATLHPELKSSPVDYSFFGTDKNTQHTYFKKTCGEGGIRTHGTV